MTTANIVRRGLRIVYNSQLNRNWSIFLYVLVDDLVWFGLVYTDIVNILPIGTSSRSHHTQFFFYFVSFFRAQNEKKERNTNIFNHEFNGTPINGLFLEREPNKLRWSCNQQTKHIVYNERTQQKAYESNENSTHKPKNESVSDLRVLIYSVELIAFIWY